jgi:predicted pyridoxine 5'-phosphate oxidase superfamily flavin-nucleotide-binding protein
MGHKFAELAFTDSVRQVQQEQGSRNNYAAMEQGEDYNDLLGSLEADFISQRDSFYMSSVSETGWPYLQHRGGPVGFMRILDNKTIGFADFQGNRQYVSTGNFQKNDRVSLFFMDYPNKRRLKVLGRARQVGLEEKELLAEFDSPNYRAHVERGFEIKIEAFDWNCPQHITPRFTQSQVDELMAPLVEEIRELKFKLELNESSEEFSF